ncbi:MFS transporter [Falsibacillus pallidus]|uniref:Putative MFS family arabinose efflux permease n=1 Tax=Falsibacillus pallidus TaxID=493781 RepID=A0A370GR80_9BACI|nr:MFS transporter [Falsibacillus pallidus]RDI45756.1 putative MFS family arabinose efflux permease [Falsibacillus pallidus]
MSLWKNRDFLLLWVGNTVSVFGNRLYMIALMWYIAEKTGSSVALGLSVLCFTIPTVIFSPIAGVLSDRNLKKQLLISTDLLNGVLMIGMSLLILAESFPLAWLYVLMILSSSVSAFFSPAISSTVPLIVPQDQLAKANSLTQMTTQMSNILGPAIGGALIAFTDMWILFLINGVSFILSALSESFIRIPILDLKNRQSKFMEQFKEGLQYIWHFGPLLHLIAVGGILINFFLAPLQVYITIICSQILQTSASTMGFIDASISIGALAGSLLILWNVFKNKTAMVIFGLSIEGIALLIAGLFLQSYFALISFAFVLGFGISLASVGISTLFQTLVPDDKRGRVGSVLTALSTFIVPIGTLFGSFIINYIAMSSILSWSGLIVALSGISLIIPFMKKAFVEKTKETAV